MKLISAFVSLLAAAALLATGAQAQTDWGGGYRTGPDNILVTPSRSGGGGALQVGPDLAASQRCTQLAAYATAWAGVNKSRSRFTQIPDAPTAVIGAEVVAAERDIPEVCRVTGVVAPNINFELRMPTQNWNGKFMHYGCGGACGVVYRPQLEEPLARGYAVVSSDMGHNAAPNVELYRWGDIQGVIDFGFRATHVVTLAAKEIIDEYYGHQAARSYYMGCSTGGVQGVIEAQRYPYDFDGILVGAPAYQSGPNFLQWNAMANLDAKGDPILSAAKLPMVRKAVLDACDALDGLKDGLLQNPELCRWDPGALACKAAAANDCLTATEVGVIRKIYAGPTDSQGRALSYGPDAMVRGSEYGWSPSFITTKELPSQWLTDPASSFGDWAYPTAGANTGKPYDYDVDPRRGNLFWGGSVMQWMRYAGNPDLRRFRDNGGKMLLYHGWDDNEVAPGSSVDYYRLTSQTMGGEEAAKGFFRLFMFPGMAHCRRGPGGDAADMITALENWVEKAQAPDQLIVHHLVQEQNYLGLPRPRYPLPAGSFDRTRPIYPYPDTAVYAGKGDPNQASSWKKAPRK